MDGETTWNYIEYGFQALMGMAEKCWKYVTVSRDPNHRYVNLHGAFKPPI
jgi:hypothetical protein